MVDGIKVGEVVSSSAKERFGEDGTTGDTYIDAQDFQDADMVVIKRKPLSVKGEKVIGSNTGLIAEYTTYECYGLYGNNVVTSTVNKKNIRDINKKYIWAIRKPYILNGD